MFNYKTLVGVIYIIPSKNVLIHSLSRYFTEPCFTPGSVWGDWDTKMNEAQSLPSRWSVWIRDRPRHSERIWKQQVNVKSWVGTVVTGTLSSWGEETLPSMGGGLRKPQSRDGTGAGRGQPEGKVRITGHGTTGAKARTENSPSPPIWSHPNLTLPRGP